MSDESDSRREVLDWGPGGPPEGKRLVPSWTPGPGYADTRGPYYEATFPPRLVTPWIHFKRISTGMNIVRRLWDEREALRADYETVHGEEPERWPVRHPGVVLECVQWVAHAACLGCQWIDRTGTSMRDEGWRETAKDIARRHQNSGEIGGEEKDDGIPT